MIIILLLLLLLSLLLFEALHSFYPNVSDQRNVFVVMAPPDAARTPCGWGKLARCRVCSQQLVQRISRLSWRHYLQRPSSDRMLTSPLLDETHLKQEDKAIDVPKSDTHISFHAEAAEVYYPLAG